MISRPFENYFKRGGEKGRKRKKRKNNTKKEKKIN